MYYLLDTDIVRNLLNFKLETHYKTKTIRFKFIIAVDETTPRTEAFKFEEEEGFPIIPNIPIENNNAEKIDDDDLFNFDVPQPKMKQDMNTDYYHDVGTLQQTQLTPTETRLFTEQGLGWPSDIKEETFERTTINNIKQNIRKWDAETVTEGEGLRYPTYPTYL